MDGYQEYIQSIQENDNYINDNNYIQDSTTYFIVPDQTWYNPYEVYTATSNATATATSNKGLKRKYEIDDIDEIDNIDEIDDIDEIDNIDIDTSSVSEHEPSKKRRVEKTEEHQNQVTWREMFMYRTKLYNYTLFKCNYFWTNFKTL
jgi:hypothetical protein